MDPRDIPELDDAQPRDWLHRPSIDPKKSWRTLWAFPTNAQGSVKSGPCQCLNGGGTCSAKGQSSCGICIHDPVILGL